MTKPKQPEPETLTAELVSTGDAAPGPAGRMQRTLGQGGGALVAVQLAQAFSWGGSDHWTAEQAAQRWPAITAALLLAISMAQNAFNWWRSERKVGVQSVTVTADEG